MKEIWKDIDGYKGLYQVSNLGRVKVLSHKIKRGFCECFCESKILKPSKKDNDYLFVRLSKGTKKNIKAFYVHRLVAMAFIENKDLFCNQIDHIDGNKTNNVVSNLRWVTMTDNVNNPNTKYKSKRLVKVKCYNKNGCAVGVFDSLTSASKFTNIPVSTISSMISINHKGNCNGKRSNYYFCRI